MAAACAWVRSTCSSSSRPVNQRSFERKLPTRLGPLNYDASNPPRLVIQDEVAQNAEYCVLTV